MDDVANSPLLNQIAEDLQNALHDAGASLEEDLREAAPGWKDLAEEGKNRLRAALTTLLTQHRDTVQDLIDALNPDVEGYASGHPEPEDEAE